MGISIQLTVNGKSVQADVDPRTLLSDFIRVNLGLTGTHVGCDTAQCGACTVHLDGRAVKACNVLVAQAQGSTVLTIEGLAAADGKMHPMQEAFRDCHGLQCGFCTPGMVMSALDLVARHPGADEKTSRSRGNLAARLPEHREGGPAGRGYAMGESCENAGGNLPRPRRLGDPWAGTTADSSASRSSARKTRAS